MAARGGPSTILCCSSYEKGQEFLLSFLRTVPAQICSPRAFAHREKLRKAIEPREAIDENVLSCLKTPLSRFDQCVTFTARNQNIDRIGSRWMSFDMKNVSGSRNIAHNPAWALPLTTVRYFPRQTPAMRTKARERRPCVLCARVCPVPLTKAPSRISWLAFPLLDINTAAQPRSQSSRIGMKKIHHPPDELAHGSSAWRDQSPIYWNIYSGHRFSRDIVRQRAPGYSAETHAYCSPPSNVSHGGGVLHDAHTSREGRGNRATSTPSKPQPDAGPRSSFAAVTSRRMP